MPHRILRDTWQMQYRRMRRSRQAINTGYSNSEAHDDAVYHFFLDAWHLKNWLESDPAVPKEKQATINGMALAYPALRAAREIANGAKHLELNDDGPPDHATTSFVERELIVPIVGPHNVKNVHRYLVDGTTMTVSEIADRILDDWDSLLARLGLQT